MKLKTCVKPPKPEPKVVNLRLSEADLRAIEKNAAKYAGGNVSAWLRYAGAHFVPKREDLAEEK